MRNSKAWLITWIAFTLAACSETRTERRVDRGTEQMPTTEGGALPKGVQVDEKGRWSLDSAPALDPETIAPKNSMMPASTGNHLRVFFERLPTADEMAVLPSEPATHNLVLRSFSSRLIIQSGCLRLDLPDRPLVRFVAPPLIQRDATGYLVLGGHDADGRAGFSRIGEDVVWFHGPFEHDQNTGSRPLTITDPDAVAPIHAACGLGRVVSLPPVVLSAALLQASQMDAAVKQFREMYGVDEATARRKLGDCRNSGACGVVSPPPPVMDAKMCPAGTSLESGLCRTAEGYIRPIP